MKHIKTFALSLVLMLCMSLTAFAASKDDVNSSIISAVVAGVDTGVIENTIISAGGKKSGADGLNDPQVISIGSNIYYIEGSQLDSLKESIDSLTEAGIKEQQNKAVSADEVIKQLKDDTGLAKLYGKADVGAATTAMSGFMPLISFATGALAVIGIFGMTVFTGCDICYLAIPILHGKMEQAGNSGGKASSTDSKGNPKFALITEDAVTAYENSQKDGTSPWGDYLKRRAVAFIFMAITIYILLTGNMTMFITMALNFVSGIIEQLNRFATILS